MPSRARPSAMLTLPEELRILIADQIVLNGDAYWFASACHTTRAAVDTACRQRGLPERRTMLSTAFTSIKRLRAAVQLPQMRNLALANQLAPGVEHRPATLDGHYCWSSVAEQAMVRGAPREVMDYAWAHWDRSLDPTHPACALRTICAHGRVDLLQHMYDAPCSGGTPRLGQSLRHLLQACVEGCHPAFGLVAKGIISPMLRGAAPETFEWYYARMEELETQWGTSVPTWRRQFESWGSLQQLALASTFSRLPYQSLSLLVDRVWPLLGNRAPLLRPSSVVCVACVVLNAEEPLSRSTPPLVGAWQWLQSRFPAGLLSVLLEANTDRDFLTRGMVMSKMHAQCFCIRDLSTYHWFQANAWWVKEALFPGELEWWLPPSLVALRSNADSCRDPVGVALAHLALREARKIDGDLPRARKLAASALCDLLTWHDGSSTEILQEVMHMLDWSVHAFSDAIRNFAKWQPDASWYDDVMRHATPRLLEKISEYTSWPEGTVIEGEGDVVQSISHLREVLDTWEHERPRDGK